MKKLLKLAAALLAAAALANAAVIKVGISPDYPPFDALTDGHVSGFDVELTEQIAALSGDEVSWQTMSFDGLIAALAAGKIDAIASAMSASAARKKACDFSDVYYQARTIYLKRADSLLNQKDELRGIKVGAQLGTVQEAAMRAHGAKVVSNENPTVLVLALAGGKLDAIAIDALVGREFLAKNADLVEFFSESDGTEGFSIAFGKGKNPELLARWNAALAEFKATPAYTELLKKYNID